MQGFRVAFLLLLFAEGEWEHFGWLGKPTGNPLGKDSGEAQIPELRSHLTRAQDSRRRGLPSGGKCWQSLLLLRLQAMGFNEEDPRETHARSQESIG